jgi:hypothetical protein
MQPYSSELEAQMRDFYWSLSEKDRRRYAAIEAAKLGHGGFTYLAQVFGCDRHPFAQGKAELRDLATIPDLDAAFLRVLADQTAGSPMDEQIKWTNLTHRQIVRGLSKAGIPLSVTVVKQLLRKHGFVRRKAQKQQAAGESQHRNQQFERIAELKAEYLAAANPVISLDTKKKN